MKQNGARKHRTWVVWTLMFAACKILKQPITRPKSAFYPVSKLAVETLELECFSTWHLNNVAFPLITHKWIFFMNEKASWGWLTLLFAMFVPNAYREYMSCHILHLSQCGPLPHSNFVQCFCISCRIAHVSPTSKYLKCWINLTRFSLQKYNSWVTHVTSCEGIILSFSSVTNHSLQWVAPNPTKKWTIVGAWGVTSC